MDAICHSCRRARSVPVTGGLPVCPDCQRRLDDRNLRPREWWNLASIHGWWQYELFDDFYSDEGVAAYPRRPVVDPEAYPLPDLASLDAHNLVGHAMTRWWLRERDLPALRACAPALLLTAMRERLAQNPHPKAASVVFEVCAQTLGTAAADFLREHWSRADGALVAAVHAAVSCLPHDEAIDRALAAVDAAPVPADAMNALTWLQSERVLDWIERTIAEPLTDRWGTLASYSALSWRRVVAWLEAGRPLSLVALDALTAPRRSPAPAFQDLRRSLVDPPPRDEYVRVLEDYRARDDVLRVRRAVAALLKAPPADIA